MTRGQVLRFRGQIVGLGSESGVRVVLGRWADSPLGSFSDLMIEQADGWRVLLAPSTEVAEFVSTTYTFDEVVVGTVAVDVAGVTWRVRAPGLELGFQTGRRTGIGRLLQLVPRFLATWPGWLTLINPLARVIMRGVSTRGSAGGGRTEYYGAYDVLSVRSLEGRWRGADLGALAEVHPPVRFGFGSTPRRPALTSLVTTITGA